MKTCANCHREFPDELIQEMASSKGAKLTYTPLDAVCALEIRNKSMGLPLTTLFNGPQAHALYERTLQYLEETYE